MNAAIVTLAALAVILAGMLASSVLIWRMDVRAKENWRSIAVERMANLSIATAELGLAKERERSARDAAARYRSLLTNEQRASTRAMQETHDAIVQIQSNPATTVQQHIDLGKQLLGYDATMPDANPDDDNSDKDRTPTVRLAATAPKSSAHGER